MPELPDIIIYIEQLEARLKDHILEEVCVSSPFLVRTWDPPLACSHGKRILRMRRIGKRIVFCLEDDLFLVLHLMIAGRLHWKPQDERIPGKIRLAAFRFPNGTLILTEAGSKKRASLSLIRGAAALEECDPGGLEVPGADCEAFAAALLRENHTLKRSLTDPHLFCGIGNAYSDEILHRAHLSVIPRL